MDLVSVREHEDDHEHKKMKPMKVTIISIWLDIKAWKIKNISAKFYKNVCLCPMCVWIKLLWQQQTNCVDSVINQWEQAKRRNNKGHSRIA